MYIIYFIIGQMLPNCKTHQILCFLAFSGKFVIEFSGNNFFQDCTGYYSKKCLILEKA